MTTPTVTVVLLLLFGIVADAAVAIAQFGAGGTPVVTVSVVTALALVDGPHRGMIVGFAIGVVLDLLAAPAVGGVHALGCVVAGATAGAVGKRAPQRLRSRPLIGVVVVPAMVVCMLTLHDLLGRPAVSVTAAVQWAAVSGGLITPLCARVARRFAIGALSNVAL